MSIYNATDAELLDWVETSRAAVNWDPKTLSWVVCAEGGRAWHGIVLREAIYAARAESLHRQSEA